MQPLPHRYVASARATADGDAIVTARDVSPELTTAPPPEYDGPGGLWSPETLLVAAAVDCLALTFRAMAANSKLAWRDLACEGVGEVDRAEGTTRFVALRLRARLLVPAGTDVERARRVLEKAERGCLVTRSLRFDAALETEIAVAP